MSISDGGFDLYVVMWGLCSDVIFKVSKDVAKVFWQDFHKQQEIY